LYYIITLHALVITGAESFQLQSLHVFVV